MKSKYKFDQLIIWGINLIAVSLFLYLAIVTGEVGRLLSQLLIGLIIIALPLSALLLFSKLKKKWVFKIYHQRNKQSRKWFDRFGIEQKNKIKEYLHDFADSYLFPYEMICKLSPDDEVIKFYHRYRKFSCGDCMENEMFYDFITLHHGLETEEDIFDMTLGDLFEKVLNHHKYSEEGLSLSTID